MAAAAELARVLPPDVTLALHGDLGAGKTVFVKGLAKAWGITETVTSPTFTLFSIYEGARQLVHLDAYRLDSPGAVEELMIEEFLRTPHCLAVEWPDKAGDWLPADAWHLDLSITPEGIHFIQLRTLKDRPEGMR